MALIHLNIPSHPRLALPSCNLGRKGWGVSPADLMHFLTEQNCQNWVGSLRAEEEPWAKKTPGGEGKAERLGCQTFSSLQSNLLTLTCRLGVAMFVEGFVGAGHYLTIANRLRDEWFVKLLQGLVGKDVFEFLGFANQEVLRREKFTFNWESPISSWNISVRCSLTSSTPVNVPDGKIKIIANTFFLQKLPCNLVI